MSKNNQIIITEIGFDFVTNSIAMDKIILNNLEFQGKHGVLDFERVDCQTFIVSLELGVDLVRASQSDDLNDTVDYSKVYECVRHCVEDTTCYLIEALAGNILKEIFKEFEEIVHITIKLEKPNAPMDAKFDSVGVVLTRART